MQSQEMSEKTTQYSGQELDRDMFLRVWDRVMPRESDACPVEVERMESHCRTDAEPCGGDFPECDGVPCLGSGAAGEQGQLRKFVSMELEHWQIYRVLAQRSCQGARMLSAMAGNCRRRAKRLSAALFLITNVRFWPSEQQCVQVPRSWLGALREQFIAEQSRECAYRAAAEDCRDRCLQELYLDMARECAEHAAAIRTLVENA